MIRLLSNSGNFILFVVFLYILAGCTDQRINRENKGDSYAELVIFLGSDMSTTTSSGTITIEYCPDNTCESFSMPSRNPIEKLGDFVYLYLYAVSDYRVLDDFRKKVEPEQVDKIIQRNSQGKTKNNEWQSVEDVIESIATRYSINAKFVRYDESKRNEVDIDLKSRIKKLK